MSVVNPFAGADYEAGVNQSVPEGAVTQGYSTASTAFGAGQAPSSGSSGGGFGAIGGAISGLLNPKNARNMISGLFPGGGSAGPKVAPTVGFSSDTGSASSAEGDWRVRVSLADNSTLFYKDPTNTTAIMKPLIETSGVIFPYTPTITVSHTANYTSASLTHSNYAMQYYNNSEVSDIVITGDFTVQNINEGKYLMAVIYFLRSSTKMFFGSGANAGNPPPILFLDGYGSHYFPHVPCVLTNFTHTLANDVDYVQVPVEVTTLKDVAVSIPPADAGVNLIDNGAGQLVDPASISPNWGSKKATGATMTQQYSTMTSHTRVPTQSQISITLRPVYSRKNLHDRFDLNKFAAGALLGDKQTGYGGFI